MQNTLSETPFQVKSRKSVPAIICLILGLCLLLFDLLVILPVYVPMAMGYRTFFITTGSMDPVIPTGSIAYFKYADPSSLLPGEVIAYTNSDGIVVVHRIKNNVPEERYVQAKGDNNKVLDRDRISYDRVHGIYGGFIPGIGKLMYFMHSIVGKILMITLAIFGVLLIVLAIVFHRLNRRKYRQP